MAAPGEEVAPGGRPLAMVHAKDEESAAPRDAKRYARPTSSATHVGEPAKWSWESLQVIPKAELHVHLEGTAPPDLIRRIAERNGLELPDGLFAAPDRFAYRDFLDFLDTYDKAASVIRTGEDYRDITYEYLVKCAGEGAVYVELTASPDHARSSASPTRSTSTASRAASTTPASEDGIEGRILDLLRAQLRRGAGAARRPLRRRAPAPVHRRLLDGRGRGELPARRLRGGVRDRRRRRSRLHRSRRRVGRPRERARAASSCRSRRIAHGVRAIEDPALVEELAERGVFLECCPTSNVVLGIYPSYEEHPLPRLRDAGVRVTLGSDDPP